MKGREEEFLPRRWTEGKMEARRVAQVFNPTLFLLLFLVNR